MGPLEGGIKWPTAEHWPGQIVPSAPADDYSCMDGGGSVQSTYLTSASRLSSFRCGVVVGSEGDDGVCQRRSMVVVSRPAVYSRATSSLRVLTTSTFAMIDRGVALSSDH